MRKECEHLASTLFSVSVCCLRHVSDCSASNMHSLKVAAHLELVFLKHMLLLQHLDGIDVLGALLASQHHLDAIESVHTTSSTRSELTFPKVPLPSTLSRSKSSSPMLHGLAWLSSNDMADVRSMMDAADSFSLSLRCTSLYALILRNAK